MLGKIIRTILLIVFLSIVFINIGAGCVQELPQPADPIPIDQFRVYVQKQVHFWLFVRVEKSQNDILKDPTAGWRQAKTIEQIEQWFVNTFEPDILWNLSLLTQNLRTSELYKQVGSSQLILCVFVKLALSSWEL